MNNKDIKAWEDTINECLKGTEEHKAKFIPMLQQYFAENGFRVFESPVAPKGTIFFGTKEVEPVEPTFDIQ